jgi:hypothetical protein
MRKCWDDRNDIAPEVYGNEFLLKNQPCVFLTLNNFLMDAKAQARAVSPYPTALELH